VIDVVNFIRVDLRSEIRLVAFISLRYFIQNKKKIRKEMPDAIVLPMFPGVKRWRKNAFLLKTICKRLKADKIIGRSVLATQLALLTGIKNVIYDGRGAIAHEWKEYKVITDPGMLSVIIELEKECILKSSFRIAVSEAMIEIWKKEYEYASNKHVVIPCTLNAYFEKISINAERILAARKKIGIKKENVVYVFSGSVAGWQSIQMLKEFMTPVLSENKNAKLLFLTRANETIRSFQNEFNDQISCFELKPKEVAEILIAADYGLLIREQSITNKVASPVKFAEYLACGLKVIISENLGDYSDFIQKYDAGSIFTKFNKQAEMIPMTEKKRLRELALKHFTKKEYREQYKQVISI